MKKSYCLLAALLAAVLLAGCGIAPPSATTMHLKRMEGTVGVSDDAGKDVDPRENLGLYSGYGVETNRKSYAWVDLDEVKLTKLDEKSEIEITKKDKHLEIEVLSGSLFFHVTEPLEDDETMTIRASSMAVGIRGTCGWVTLEDDDHLTLYLLEGKVECTARKETASVTAGQMAQMSEDGEIEVTFFAESDIPSFVLDELDNDFLDEVLELLEEAAAVPDDPDSGSPDQEQPEEPAPIVLASEPPLNEWALKQPIPDFLNEEQQQLFIHAYCAYSAFLSGCPSNIDSFPLADGSKPSYVYETVEIDGQTYALAWGRYRQWDDFQAMMDGLFTPGCRGGEGRIIAEIFRSTEDGLLCYLETGIGSDPCYNGNETDTYELVSQTKDEIAFNLIGHYTELDYDPVLEETVLGESYTVPYLIRMVHTDQGWRVAEMDVPQ